MKNDPRQINTVVAVTGARDDIANLLPKLQALLGDPEIQANKPGQAAITAAFENLVYAAVNMQMVSTAMGHPNPDIGETIYNAVQLVFPWIGSIRLPPGVSVESLSEGLSDFE